MGTLKYKGHEVKFNTDPTQEELDQTIAYLDSLPEKEENNSTSFLENSKLALAGAARPFLQAGYTLAGLLDKENIGAIDDERKAVLPKLQTWANPENKEQSFGGKVTGMISTLPIQMAAMPFSPFDTGQTLADNGESMDTVRTGTLLDTAGNVLGLKLPAGIGKGILAKTASGAITNAAQDTATRAAISGISEKDESKKYFEPTMETAALAAIPGAGFGAIHGIKTKPLEAMEDGLSALRERLNSSTGEQAYSVKDTITTRIEEASRQMKSAKDSMQKDEQFLQNTKNNTKPEIVSMRDKAVERIKLQTERYNTAARTARNLTEILNTSKKSSEDMVEDDATIVKDLEARYKVNDKLFEADIEHWSDKRLENNISRKESYLEDLKEKTKDQHKNQLRDEFLQQEIRLLKLEKNKRAGITEPLQEEEIPNKQQIDTTTVKSTEPEEQTNTISKVVQEPDPNTFSRQSKVKMEVDSLLSNNSADIPKSIPKKAGEVLGSIKTQFIKNFLGKQYSKNLFENKFVDFISNIIDSARDKKTKFQNDMLLGNYESTGTKQVWSLQRKASKTSPKELLNKSTDKDVYIVLDLFLKNVGKKNYLRTLKEDGNHLTQHQQDLFYSLAKMFTMLRDRVNKHYLDLEKTNPESTNGSPKIPNYIGWIPSIRQGSYVVNLVHDKASLVKSLGKETSNVIYSQRFFSEAEAKDFIHWFEQQPNEYGIRHTGVERLDDKKNLQTKAEFADEFKKLLETTTDKKELEMQIELLKEKYADSGRIGTHHKLRLNVPGYKGTELWATKEQAGRSFRDSIFDSVDEWATSMFKDQVRSQTDLLNNRSDYKEKYPGSYSVTKDMVTYAMNEKGHDGYVQLTKEMLDNVITSIKLGANPKEKKYLQQHFTDSVIGKMSRLFYISVLTMRPSFWVAQGSQFLWVNRSLVNDGVGPLSAIIANGEGWRIAATQPKDFRAFLDYAIKRTHTFHPSFINDMNTFHAIEFKEGSNAKLFADLVTGEKQSSVADSFSRYMASAMLFSHYKRLGYTGEKLYKTVIEKTDENMVQYGRLEKAPIFEKLGIVGELASPLQTFSQASLGNLLSDIKYLKNRKTFESAYPALMTFGISIMMSGLIGAPLVAEYELFARLINYLSSLHGLDARLPLASEWVLKDNDSFGDRILSHGTLSASTTAITPEGFDIGSSLRWQPVLGGIVQGEKSFLEVLPAVNWALQISKASITVARSKLGDDLVTNAEYRSAANTILPGWTKGIYNIVHDKQDTNYKPDTFGRAKRDYSVAEHAAEFLGTKTITGSTEERKLRILNEKKKSQSEIKTQLIRNAVDEMNGDKKLLEKYIIRLSKDFHMSGEDIKTALKTEIKKRNIPEGLRKFYDSNLKKKDIMLYNDIFNENPLKENDDAY